MFLRQNTLQPINFGPFLSSSDGFTPQTGLTIAQANMQLSKDGGAFSSIASGSATHDSDGWYTANLTIDDVDTVGELKFKAMMTGTNTLPVWDRWWVLEEPIYDALYGASAGGFDANQRVDIGQWLSTAVTISSTTNKPEVDVNSVSDDATAADNLELDYDGTGYNKSNSTIGTTTANTDMRGTDNAALASIATEARLAELDAANMPTDLSNIEADTQDIQSRLPAALVAGRMSSDAVAISGDTVAADNLELDYDGTGYNKANSTIGTTTTNTDMRGTDSALLAANINVAAGVVESNLVQIEGTAQSATDLKDFADAGYDPSTNQVEGVKLVDTTTTNTDTRGTDNAALASVATETRLAELDAGNIPTDLSNIETDTQDIQSRLPATLVSGRIDADVGFMQTGTVTAAVIATDAIDADALAADAIAEIQSGLGTSANQTTILGRLPTALVSGRMNSDVGFMQTGTVTAAALATDAVDEIVDGVWDEILTGATHNISTSAGRRLRQIAHFAIREETAQGPGTGPNQIQFDVGANAVDGAYDPAMVVIIEGTGVGQSRNIHQYDGASRTATVDRNWKVPPDATSVFQIVADSGREHVNEGLAQGGTLTTITLNALASSIDDVYVGQAVFIRSGTGDDQRKFVIAYNGTTKVATVHQDWDIIPDTTSDYVMLPQATGDYITAQMAELTGIADIPASPTIPQALMLTYMRERNDYQTTSSERRILNDAGVEVLDAPMSDNGTVFSQGKLTDA